MKKTSFWSRLVFSTALFFLLSYLKIEGMILLEDWIISVFCISISFFFGPVLFLTTHIPLFILAVADLHLKRMYQLSVFEAAPWISMFILDANASEIQEYLPKISMTEYALLACVPLFSALVWSYHPQKKLSKLWYIIFWFAFLTSYLSHLYPTASVFLSSNGKNILNAHKEFKFNPSASETAAHNVIIIIGESHRYSEFHEAFQKYRKEFNDLYSFDNMISLYANTMNSVPLILSRKKFQNTSFYFPEKSLFSLFEEAGYKTYFLHYTDSSDITEKNNLTFIYRDANNFVNFSSKKDSLHDIRIYDALNDILTNDHHKKLIVIKMIGIHVDFRYRYPAAYDTRKPSLKKNIKKRTFGSKIQSLFEMPLSPKDREKVLNTYKNAMDYSVEIIRSLFDLVQKQPESSLAFFSSDHGICIFEKGTLLLPPNCKEAFHIPMMFNLNPELRKNTVPEKIKNLSCNTRKSLSQEYVFETIVSLAGISYPTANKSFDLTAECIPDSGKRTVQKIPGDRSFYEDL